MAVFYLKSKNDETNIGLYCRVKFLESSSDFRVSNDQIVARKNII